MKRLPAVLLLALGACTADSGRQEVDPNTVELELRRLIAEQAREWNDGDLEGFVAFYADNAVFLAPSGLQRGRQKIFERYVKRYRDGGKEMGQLDLDPFDIRVAPSGETASVALRWNLVWQDQDPANGLALITLQRSGDDRWQILQDASM